MLFRSLFRKSVQTWQIPTCPDFPIEREEFSARRYAKLSDWNSTQLLERIHWYQFDTKVPSDQRSKGLFGRDSDPDSTKDKFQTVNKDELGWFFHRRMERFWWEIHRWGSKDWEVFRGSRSKVGRRDSRYERLNELILKIKVFLVVKIFLVLNL